MGLGPLITEVSRSNSDTPHWVGLLWAGDRTAIDNTQHLQEKDTNALRGIPTRNPIKRAAANARLRPVFLNRRAAARHRALASIISGREKPKEITICYKISLVQLITNLNVILYLSTCHTVNISVLILFMIMP